MPNPYIVVNEWDGHTNMSFYDQNNTFQGTWGQNVGNFDNNTFNGFEGGVFNETGVYSGTPISATTFSLSQSTYDSLISHVQLENLNTLMGNDYYYFVGANCVDKIDSWLNYAGVSYDPFSLYSSGSLLDNYMTGREWLTDGWDWIYSEIDGITGFNYNLLDDIDSWLDDFWDGVEALFSSDSDDDVADNENSLVNTIYSPIAIDLDGNGLNTTHYFDKSVEFDLDGNGTLDRTAWLSSGDAFLAVDLNHDGVINNGSELFGGPARGDGYSELANYDSNQNGIISLDDEMFDQLLVWQDLNSDGVSTVDEVFSLQEASVTEISVQYHAWDEYDRGNLIGEHSWATVNGVQTKVGDIYFIADLEAA